MRLFFNECYKVFAKRSFIVLVIGATLLNGFLLYRDSTRNDTVPYDAGVYRQVFQTLQAMDEQQAKAYIEQEYETLKVLNTMYADPDWPLFTGELSPTQHARYLAMLEGGTYPVYTNHIFDEYRLWQYFYECSQGAANYPDYVEEILYQSEVLGSVSIFSGNDAFSRNNIQKTAEDYAPLRDRELPFDMSKGIDLATGFVSTDLITIFCILYAAVQLYEYEKRKGLIMLIRPTRYGQTSTILSKIGVLLVSSCFFVLLFYGSNLLIAHSVYGLGDLSRPVQSVLPLMGLTMQSSVLGYLVFYLLSKIALYFAIGLLLLLLSILAKHPAMTFGCFIAILGIETALYYAIPKTSILSLFRYANLVYFAVNRDFYRVYTNANVFTVPVNTTSLFLAFVFLLTAFLLIACIVTHDRMKKGNSVQIRLTSPLKAKSVSVSLFSHESFKALWINKAAVILLAFVVFQIFFNSQFQATLSSEDYYYRNYMSQISGEVTEDTLAFVSEEQGRFEEAAEQLRIAQERYQSGEISVGEYYQISAQTYNDEQRLAAFQRMTSRIDAIQAYEQEHGVKLWLLDDYGVNEITANRSFTTDKSNALFLVLILAICLGGIYGAEYQTGMNRLIPTFKNGRGRVVGAKTCIAFLLTIAVTAAAYLPQLAAVSRELGLHSIEAPVQSLEHLQAFPFHVSILGYFILLYGMRLLAGLMAACIILLISVFTKDALRTTMFGAALFAGPLCISLLGIQWVDRVSFNAILTGNMVFHGGGTMHLVSTAGIIVAPLLCVLLGIIAEFIVRKKFCGSGGSRKQAVA